MMIVRRVARPMLAAMFLVGGLDQVRHPDSKSAAARKAAERISDLTSYSPDPDLLVRVNGATMLGAAALLATGRMPRMASLALLGTLVPTTLSAHAFWSLSDPAQRANQKVQFLKNVGLGGGLLLAAADTEGRPGLAYRAKMAGDSARRIARASRREARQLARAAAREAKLTAAQVQNAL